MKKYTFTAEIKEGTGGGAWIEFPYDVRAEFGTGGRVPVHATFDGIPYRGSLAPMGGTCHIVGVLKEIRQRLGKNAGETVSVVLARDEEERTVAVPPELLIALEKNPEAGKRFEAMSFTHRKEWARYVDEAKNADTRLRRAEKAVLIILEKSAASAKADRIKRNT
jgi:flagellar biosynthesis regulator FlaF